jgi:hypothetical protein
MNPAFDTLGASKRLRDAGVEERAADAIVELVQSATHFPDISGLATKSDVTELALTTKADLQGLKADLLVDVQGLKADLLVVKAEISISENRVRAEINDKLRLQSFALMGAMTAIVGLATAIIKLAP